MTELTDSTSTTETPTAALSAAGVSIWLDDLSRERINSGGLQKLIAEKNVVGVTTNPTIFAAALSKGDAYDEQVRRLAAAGVSVDDAIIEIPATIEDLEAITKTNATGISVNVTLIFSLERHRQVIDAYLTGLEKAKEAGIDLSGIHSVASFFVSRVDT